MRSIHFAVLANTLCPGIGGSGCPGPCFRYFEKRIGKYPEPNNWQVSFSDIEGKTKMFNAHFACVKGGRVLWLGDTQYGRVE
jgi:hypothetical protein